MSPGCPRRQKPCCSCCCGGPRTGLSSSWSTTTARLRISFPCSADSASLLRRAIRNRLSLCPRAMCCPSRIFRRIRNFRRSARPRCGRSRRGRPSIVVTPIAATAILQRSAEYYTDLARVLRRGESFDLENLLGHLNTVGYSFRRCGRNAGRVRGARRHSRRVFAGGRAPGTHRVLRR